MTKDADFTTVCPESFGETRCNGHVGEREREASAQCTEADRKESLRSHSSEGQKALGKLDALFSSEQGNLIRSSVFGNANPSNLRGSLLEGNKDHLHKAILLNLVENKIGCKKKCL